MVAPIWDSNSGFLKSVRQQTQLARSSNEWIFPLLRRGLVDEGLDPERTVVTQLYPDGGSDYGMIIGSDGIVRRVDRQWRSQTIEFTVLTEDPFPSDALYLYGGWVLFNDEGRGPKDPTDALVPFVRWGTREFRSRERISGGVRRPRDWSLPNRLLTEVGADPSTTIVMPPAAEVHPHRPSLGWVFLVADGRVFFLAAALNPEWDPIEALEWQQLRGPEIEEICGPLYEAAIRVQTEERN